MATASVSSRVENLSLEEAIKLLQRAKKAGGKYPHAISIMRDPRNPKQILALNAVEVDF